MARYQRIGSRIVRFLSAFAVAVCLLAAPQGEAMASEADTGPENAQVIVRFRPGTEPRVRESILKGFGAEAVRHFALFTDSVARIPDARLRAMLRAHPDVLDVIPDRPIRKDEIEIQFDPVEEPTGERRPKGGAGGGGGSTQVVPAGVQRIGAAPGSLAVTGKIIGVAVVDTGIDSSHADFQREGFNGVNWLCHVETSFRTSCEDDNGHGTHVAGIIGASNNSIGVVGVAPDVMLFSVKVLDSRGDGTDSTLIAGLEWIINNASAIGGVGIQVVNMSLGRSGTLTDNQALHDRVRLLKDRGVLLVASAGNCASREVKNSIPAGYREVMAVASSTALTGTSTCTSYTAAPADMASRFTTDGWFAPVTGTGVTISAPGEDLETRTKSGTSCIFGSQGILSLKRGGGTERRAGTSMAAPHLAGVAALRIERLGRTTPALEDFRTTVRSGADRIGVAPLDPAIATCGTSIVPYTFDGEREGILRAAAVN